MLGRMIALSCRLQKNSQVFFDRFLSNVFAPGRRAKRLIKEKFVSILFFILFGHDTCPVRSCIREHASGFATLMLELRMGLTQYNKYAKLPFVNI